MAYTKKIITKRHIRPVFFMIFLFGVISPSFAFAGWFTDWTSGCDTGQLACVEIFAQKVLDLLLTITTPLAILAIVYGGILYMISAGDDAKAKKAKWTIFYALIGVALIVGANILIDFVPKLIGGQL